MRNFLVVCVIIIGVAVGLQKWIEGLEMMSAVLVPKNDMLRSEASLGGMNLPSARSFDATVALTPAAEGSTPLEVADNYVRAHREEWNIQPHHELRPTLFQTPLGSRVKYVVYQDDLPVIGLDILLQISRNMEVTKVDSKYRALPKADLKARVMTSEDVVETAAARFAPETDGSAASSVLYAPPSGAEPELAYVIPMKERTTDARSVQILFRASDGQVLGRSFSRVEF